MIETSSLELLLDNLAGRIVRAEEERRDLNGVLSQVESTIYWSYVACSAIFSGGLGRLFLDYSLMTRDLEFYFREIGLGDLSNAVAELKKILSERCCMSNRRECLDCIGSEWFRDKCKEMKDSWKDLSYTKVETKLKEYLMAGGWDVVNGILVERLN